MGLTEGASKSEMSRRFQLPRKQIYRHLDHMDGPPTVEVLSEDLVSAVVPRLERLILEVEAVKGRAVEKGDDRLVLSAVRIHRELLSEVARLRGEIETVRSLTLDALPQWAVVLEALDGHPRARLEVAKALRESA